MKPRVNQAPQVQDSAEQDKTPWKRIYEEYKSNTAGLKEKYSPLLSKELLSKQSKDSYSLANIFKNIAEANVGLARAVDTNQSLKLYHYNDGAIACHHGLSVIEKANCNNDLGLQQLGNEIYKNLNNIQTDMVSICGGKPELLQNISNKDALSNISKYGLLEQLRTETKKQLDAIEAAKEAKDDEVYIDLTAKAFKQVANDMGQYLGALYGDAEKMLGPPPCDYNVIGLGSMALRQMTPYSDLEFAILTDNENYKQSEDFRTREYFRNLTQLVHFKVINLGETIMPISSYGFDFKDFVKTAVNFDLGGKTPLGRIDKPYELIQTVDGMINYLKNEGDRTSHIDKTLLFILQKSCPIYQHGNKDLAGEYQSQANEFLLSQDATNGRPYCENRAVQVLAKGGVELDYTKQTPEEHKTSGNLKQFSLKTVQGKLFDVKQEIYRMPDRFIYNLGMIHGIQEESGWDTIDKLCKQGIINSEGTSNLKKALSFATNLRLKTYSHYGYQKDTMDYVKAYEMQSALLSREMEKELTTVFKLTNKDLKEDGALFKYYYTTLALRDKLEAFCELENLDERKEEFFKNNIFYSDDVGTKAQIYSRLLRYKDALKYQLEELEILKKSLGDEHLKIAISLNNIGITYGNLGRHEEALELHTKALKIFKSSLGEDHIDVANSYNNIGITYGNLGQHKKALEYHTKAFEIRQKYLESNPLAVAQSLNNIGNTCGALGDYNKALKKNTQALRDYKNALKYNIKALELKQESLDDNHPDLARSFNSIGCNYGDLGEYKKALEYQLKALEKRQESLGNNHPDVANSCNNISGTYRKLGHYNKILEYDTKAWKIVQKSLDNNHPNTTLCKHNISQIYCNLTMYQEALAELAGILAVCKKTNHHEEVSQYYLDAIAQIKRIKSLYEDANKLLNNIIGQSQDSQRPETLGQLKTALDQFKKCNHFEKSDIIDKKILQTLGLLIKEQTSLYQKSTKNKLAIRKQLNEYQKEYDDLKKAMDDKQVRFAEIDEYLAEQKQIRDEQSYMQLAHKALFLLETNSAFEDTAEKLDLLSLSGTLTEKNNDYNI